MCGIAGCIGGRDSDTVNRMLDVRQLEFPGDDN